MKCYAFIARFQIIVLGYLGDKGGRSENGDGYRVKWLISGYVMYLLIQFHKNKRKRLGII